MYQGDKVDKWSYNYMCIFLAIYYYYDCLNATEKIYQ